MIGPKMASMHGRMDDEDPSAAGNHRRHMIEQGDASLKGQEQRAGHRRRMPDKRALSNAPRDRVVDRNTHPI